MKTRAVGAAALGLLATLVSTVLAPGAPPGAATRPAGAQEGSAPGSAPPLTVAGGTRVVAASQASTPAELPGPELIARLQDNRTRLMPSA